MRFVRDIFPIHLHLNLKAFLFFFFLVVSLETTQQKRWNVVMEVGREMGGKFLKYPFFHWQTLNQLLHLP